MRQKVSSYEEKKRFILYKGHTGWKIKTRIFGSLLITFSAFAFAGNTNIISVHATTETTQQEENSVPEPKNNTVVPNTIKDTSNSNTLSNDEKSTQPVTPQVTDDIQKAAPEVLTTPEKSDNEINNESSTSEKKEPVAESTESSTIDTVKSGTGSEQTTKPTTDSIPEAPVSKAELMKSDTVQNPKVTPELESTQTTDQTTSTTADKYPVLSPDKDINVGVDTSEVKLGAKDIAGHFTATVENRGGSDQDDDPDDNIQKLTIGADGSVALTSNDSHKYYTSSGKSSDITGHQAAHVSFEHEIDFSHGFYMSGALGIGSKTSDGADSVGFIFAPGDPSKATQGGSGGALGLQGLNNAFGFVFDEYGNTDYNDPESSTGGWFPTYTFSPYVGWRTTGDDGKLQKVGSDSDWKKTSELTLNRSQDNTLNEFKMQYDADKKTLTVKLGGQTFSRDISDISSGYSISVAASTGQSFNDYSAKIDEFDYTPKTIPLGVKLVDSAEQDALLNKVSVKAVANIGDTVSVFSTQEAADRAVKEDHLDPNLVAVIPTDSAGNVYVIDGSKTVTGETGKVNHIGGDATVGDGTYYSYTVKDGDDQGMTIPVRLAYKAVVTPVDSKTGDPIEGLEPTTVIAVKGQPSVVEIPGYTTTKVTLDPPAAGEKDAQDKLVIDQGTTGTDTITTNDQSNPIGHYYNGDSKTVDGHEVVTNTTVGTGQSVADNLNKQPLNGKDGNPVVSGQKDDQGAGLKTITSDDYYWSNVGNATATDSTDEAAPKASGSILVPTTSTLDYLKGVAVANQTKADTYKQQSQDMHDKFVGITGLNQKQIDDADSLLQSVVDIYASVSQKNSDAKDAFEKAEAATDSTSIYGSGQTGYASLEKVQNLLISFKADLDDLTTKNDDVKGSLATFQSPSKHYTYGDEVKFPEISLGDGFGTVTDDKIKGFENPDYYKYYNTTDTGDKTPIQTPVNVGSYVLKLTDAGRTYLKSLAPDDSQAGLYVSAILTIDPKEIAAGIGDATVTYGGNDNGQFPTFSGNIGSDVVNNPDDFEVTDASNSKVSVNQLQVGKTYTISYTKDAKASLNTDSNYTIQSFGTGTLTVKKRAITVTAQDQLKTYGNPNPTFDLTSDSANGLVNDDKIGSLNVNLTRQIGETAGTYEITGQSSSSNYAVTIKNGTFTIAQKPITVTIDSPTITYGDTIPTPTFKITHGSLVGEDKDSALGVTLVNPADVKNVGTYDITGSASKTGNYTVTVNKGTLTIVPKNANSTVETNNITYGDALLPKIVGSLDTLSKDHSLDQTDFEVVDDSGNILKPEQLQVGGTYWIQYTDKAKTDLMADKNYNFESFGRAALTVKSENAKPTIETNTITYGDTSLPTIVGSLDKASEDHELKQSDFEVVDDSGNILKPEQLQVGGTYWIQYTDKAKTDLMADKNYNFESFGRAALTVKSENAKPTIETNTITYGDTSLPTIVGSLDKASEDHELKQSDFEVVDDSGNILKPEQLQVGGTYWIQYTDAAKAALTADKNYNFDSFGRAKLSVNAEKVNPTVETNTVTYGDTSLPTIIGSLNNASKDHNLDQSDFEVLDDSGNILKPEQLQVGGTYWIQYTDKAKTDLMADKNYNFESFGRAKLTVEAEEANPTVETNSITYGDTSLPKITGSLDRASKNHELNQSDFEVVDDSGTIMKPEQLQAGGTYWIQYTDKAKTALKADKNYSFKTFGRSQLTVKAENVAPTIKENSTTYGNTSLPEIIGSLNTLPQDHKLNQSDFEIVDDSGTVMKPEQLQAGGTYWIQYTAKAKAILTADKNYNFESFGKAPLEVNKAVATTTPTESTKPAELTYGDTPKITRIAKIGSKSITLNPDDFKIVNKNKDAVASDQLKVNVPYTIELTDAAINNLQADNPNYDFSKLSFGQLSIKPLNITVSINNQTMYAGGAEPQNSAKLEEGSELKDGDKLNITYEDPDSSDVGTYNINADMDKLKVDNPNYAITVVPGALKVLGKDVDADGNVTITEKDAGGNVVKVTKQWNDGSDTIYTNNPADNTKGADEVDKDGKTSATQTIDPNSAKTVLPNSDGSATVVTIDDSGQPVFTHYGVDPDHDGVTSADELKNGTDPLVFNSRGGSSSAIGDRITVKKNQNIATTTSSVKLYNNKGNLLTGRALGIDTAWYSDEEYTIGGVMYYRVATDEFAKASDVYVYIDAQPMLIRVYNNIRGELVDYQGTKLSRELSPSSQWHTDRIAVINGQHYYRVATNEFVPVEQAYPYSVVDAEVTTNFETPIYNERGEKLDIALLANGTYKADKVVTMNGVNYYRVATNQFIPVAAVRDYANVNFNMTTNVITPIYNEHGQFLNIELPAKAAYKVDRVIYVNGVHYYRVATNMFVVAKRF